MKKITRVANIELNNMFYSPIAWFILIVFIIQSGMQYTENMENFTMFQKLNELGTGFNPMLTHETFLGGYYIMPGIFTYIVTKLYLYLPLITMGLISRETSSGTIKLLYSSPLTIQEIILGKFAAMVVFSLLLVLIMAGFGITAMITIPSADYGQILSGLLGLFLLLCAYSSIGLFLSCLTTHQIIAALGTLVVFALLSYIGTVWQDIDFVRELTYYFSISGRTLKMISGLISTKDVLYFILISGLFLSFSYFKLLASRESKPGIVRISRYMVALAAVVVLVYVTSLPGLIGYLDTTQNKRNTLSPNAQKIISKMKDGPIEVTSYINLLGEHFGQGVPKRRMMDMDRWERYMRFKPDIKLKYVYYYDTSFANTSPFKRERDKSVQELAVKYAKAFRTRLSLFKTPKEIREIIDLKNEKYRYVMQIRYKDRTTFLRLYNDRNVYPSETETMAGLKRLTDNKFPTIGFLTGELERSSSNNVGEKEYGILSSEVSFRYALINQGFEVEKVHSNQKIPKHISALVIADPRIMFSGEAIGHIHTYINQGGNLLIAGEPGKQHVLEPVLALLGVQLKQGLLVQQSKVFEPDLIMTDFTKTAAGLSKAMANSKKDGAKVFMKRAAALTYKKGAFDIQPLLMSNGSNSWIKKGELSDTAEFAKTIKDENVMVSKRSRPPDENDRYKILFSEAQGDEKGSFPTAIALTREINGRQQRIVVTGDADFMSNMEVRSRYLGSYHSNNFGFGTALFGWLSHGEYPVDTELSRHKDNKMNLNDKQIVILKLFWVYLLPAMLLIYATVLLVRRRNK